MDSIVSKNHVHPTTLSISIHSASTADNWPSMWGPDRDYDEALREFVGSMTPAWRAQMRQENYEENGSFAVKYLDRERTVSKATFLELYALGSMQHDHVLRLVEAFQNPTAFYFVTNRCYGDLNSVFVQRGRAAPIGYVQGAGVQLLDALEYVHGFRF